MTDPTGRGALVILPTYNERTSLESVVSRIHQTLPNADILVVDDGSADGTAEIADALAADGRVQVLHRSHKQGLGSAYRAGFRWAENRGYEVIVECDADGSHQPEQLPALLEALSDDVSLVIGTRWMPGGSVRNWPWYRRLISKAGTGFARFALRSRLRDMTSGMRAFRFSALQRLNLDDVTADGYGFQVEMAWRLERQGDLVREVPIDFVERTQGHSKMSAGIVLEALWLVTVWGWKLRFGRKHRSARTSISANPTLRD